MIYLPNLDFNLTISPFNWLRFQVGGPWSGADALWITIGPIDLGVGWGG